MSDVEFKEDNNSNYAELPAEQKWTKVNLAETPEELRAILEGFKIIPGEDGQEHTGKEQAEKFDKVMKFIIHPTALVETYGIRDKTIEFLEKRHQLEEQRQKAERH
jgi:hypothetical protein